MATSRSSQRSGKRGTALRLVERLQLILSDGNIWSWEEIGDYLKPLRDLERLLKPGRAKKSNPKGSSH
ncbi:MAG: hypothetical protein AB1646_20460 [Thermodesulfobacteriota bacterium]